MKEEKIEIMVFKVFAFIGLIFLIIGSIICLNLFNYDNKIETVGKIEKINESSIIVSYEVEGKSYETTLNYHNSTLKEGNNIKIYYDEDSPDNIGIKSLNYIFLIFPLFGLIFMLIGLILIIRKSKEKKRETILRETGDVLYAKYKETITNINYSVNGRHPYKVICEVISEDGTKKEFKSKNLWTNPSQIIEENNIKEFPVYIDKNKKDYFIDLSKINID